MIPLSVPSLTGNERRYLNECIDTTFVSTVGPFVGRLEEMVAEAAGAPHAVATASGTAALHLALLAVGVDRDDLVLCPSFTFVATANAISHAGASPWLVDVDPADWNISVDLLREALGGGTEARDGRLVERTTGRRVAAILPVYALGVPARMDDLHELADRYQLPLVADAAAAIGARYRGRDIGPLADATTFSFNGNKIVTSGGGGAVVTADAEIAHTVRHLATTARVGRDYDHDRVGYNYRMTNVEAAIGCAQMERLDELLAAKARIDARYREELGNIPGVGLFPAPAEVQATHWLSGLVLPPRRPVLEVCDRLAEQGISGRPFWKPLHLQKPYQSSPRTAMDVCEGLWRGIITLPCSVDLSSEDQELVISAVRRILE